MSLKSIAGLFFALLTFSFPLGFASAEQVRLDAAYYEQNLLCKCIFGFSERRNERVKIFFKSKTEARFLTETYLDNKMEVSLSNGNMKINWGSGGATYSLVTENSQSFMFDVKKGLNKPSDEVYLGDCKTKWDYYERLDPLPVVAVRPAVKTPSSKNGMDSIDKNEIAALEKKLAALKQKAARKEEYQKMRALLDQKLREVQGQIQMLEQEYKDVLN